MRSGREKLRRTNVTRRILKKGTREEKTETETEMEASITGE